MALSKKHYHAGFIIFFALAAFCLLITAYEKPLYSYSVYNPAIKSTLLQELTFRGVDTTITILGGITSSSHEDWGDYSNASNQKQLWQALQSLNLVAIIVTAIVWIGLSLRWFCKIFPKFIRQLLKWAIFIATIVSPIVTLVAWVLLFDQPNALRKDAESTLAGTCAYSDFCNHFSGEQTDILGTQIKWGPDLGFWLTLAACILCFFAASLIIQGRKRYKYSRI